MIKFTHIKPIGTKPMSTQISYKDLTISMLSDKAVELMFEFVAIWRTNTGEMIDLEADDAVMKVLQNAKKSNNRRVRTIYLHLRAEFTNKIEASVTRCDPMLAVQLMSHISKGRVCRFQSREFIAA